MQFHAIVCLLLVSIFCLTFVFCQNEKFVARAEGKGYNPLVKTTNFQAGMYYILHDEAILTHYQPCSPSSINNYNITSDDEDPKNYSSYRRYPLCTPSDYVRYPKTVRDVVKIIQEAIRRGVTVKAFGQRHSQTDIICTEGIPIDNRGIKFFQMDSDNITATFGSGVSLREATEFLRKNGRALRTTPAFGNITLGGALGSGSHGSTIKYNASISSQVVKLTIVNGLGQIREISDPDDLNAFKIHLGLLGIVVSVSLYTVPLYKTKAFNYRVSDDVLTNGMAIDWARTSDQLALYWFPAFNEVVVANWTIVDVNTKGNALTNDHVPTTYANFNVIATTVKEIAFTLTSNTCSLASSLGYKILHTLEYILELQLITKIPDYAPIYTEDGVSTKNPAIGYYDLMFAPVCSDTPQGILGGACPWSHGSSSITLLDNEFGFALDDLPEFIQAVKDIISKTPTAFPMQGILMRFSSKSDIYMSTAYGRDTVHFEFYLWNRNDRYENPSGSLAGFQTILQTLARKFKGQSHWGKSGLVFHNSQSLDFKLDPRARQKFIAAMNKFDPNEVFINNFGRRLKRKGTKVDVDPLTTHCALLDNCFCSKKSDCGEYQICTSLPGYTYRVCKTLNEVPEAQVNRKEFPSLNGILEYIRREISFLIISAFGKCNISDLIRVVKDLLRSLV